MLKGAVAELSIGVTDRLSVDVGPVITAEARDGINAHIAKMRAAGHKVHQPELTRDTENGTFVAPTIIEIDSIAKLGREVFGPVLHVIRFKAEGLDALVDAINATGYGLTFGLHTRLDATIGRVTRRVAAGNLYVNRNIIGAVVGVQPFGGRGLSGTGPKAGGPIYLSKLVAAASWATDIAAGPGDAVVKILAGWLKARDMAACGAAVEAFGRQSRLGCELELPGPVGERNLYAFHPRGRIAVSARTEPGLWRQIGAVLATGNHAIVMPGGPLDSAPAGLPAMLSKRISWSKLGLAEAADLSAALVEGNADDTIAATRALAERPGTIVSLQSASPLEVENSQGTYVLDWLLEEVSTSINTTAAGGNASLMALA
jgi:RHH-type proline utilization regulon transcriptional repressor/proline dehydrogenase/delta 1-pyrroline-5-carboxylate dehydrogenase